jgi:hypothetical protein
MAPLDLRGTLWKFQALQDSSGPTLRWMPLTRRWSIAPTAALPAPPRLWICLRDEVIRPLEQAFERRFPTP